MLEISLTGWIILTLATVILGLTKSAIPGAITISVALYAAVLPAKESTGAILVLLILGDIGAIFMYRRTVSWRTVAVLMPAVLVGLLLGYWFLAVSNDAQVAIGIAIVLLLIISIGLYQSRGAKQKAQAAQSESQTEKTSETIPHHSRLTTAFQRLFYGGAGGFMTMIANAAGPALSMYFLTVRLPMRMFLGTMALFFAILNIVKLPFSIHLGLISAESLLMNLILIPALAVGFAIGRSVIKRVSQNTFEILIIVFTIGGAGYLLVQGLLTI